MNTAATALDQEVFQRDGIAWPLVAIPPDEAADLEREYRHFQREVTRVRGRECHLKPHLVSTWLDNIVHNPVILNAVEAAIGPDILLWSSDFAIKAAGKGTWIPWHQDTPYWNLSTTEVVSVWLAISPATIANGAMRVFPGTHRAGALNIDEIVRSEALASHGAATTITSSVTANRRKFAVGVINSISRASYFAPRKSPTAPAVVALESAGPFC